VRRQSKSSNSKLKVLTAAAVAAAMSAGTLTAFADTNNGIMVDMGNGDVRSFSVAQLDDSNYRNLVITAFNAANPVIVQQADGSWNEVSAAATSAGIADAAEGYDRTNPDSPFWAYE
jgi:hypothetical protein